MAKKGGQVVLQEEINTNEDWSKMLEKPGVYGKHVVSQTFPLITVSAFISYFLSSC